MSNDVSTDGSTVTDSTMENIGNNHSNNETFNFSNRKNNKHNKIGRDHHNNHHHNNHHHNNNNNHTINFHDSTFIISSKSIDHLLDTNKRRKLNNYCSNNHYNNNYQYNAKDHTAAKLRYSDDIIGGTVDITKDKNGTFGKYLINIIECAARKWKLDEHCIALKVDDEYIVHDEGNKLDCVLQKIPPNTAVFDVCKV